MSKMIWILVAAVAGFSGCSSGLPAGDLKSAEAAVEKAIALEKSGSYAEAFPLVDSSISNGGLNPDQLSEAYLLRARCHCAAGNLEEAERDIGFAEHGSPNPASWHFSRAILFSKQNKAAESKAEFALAVRIDPTLKLPKL